MVLREIGVSLQSECGVQRGHDGRGSKESKEHERRYGRHRDPTASETHLQSALLPRSPPTGTAKHITGLVHFQNKNFPIIYPHVIQDVLVFLSSVENKLRFLRKTFQDFSPYSGLQWGSTE